MLCRQLLNNKLLLLKHEEEKGQKTDEIPTTHWLCINPFQISERVGTHSKCPLGSSELPEKSTMALDEVMHQ